MLQFLAITLIHVRFKTKEKERFKFTAAATQDHVSPCVLAQKVNIKYPNING
jgi:hypothetical protein